MPGSRSMAQSQGQCGGSCKALCLLKALARSSYSGGEFGVVDGTAWRLMFLRVTEWVDGRHCIIQVISRRDIWFSRQETTGCVSLTRVVLE